LTSHPKTAILVFANSATEELMHKPMLKGEVLFEALTLDTLKKVKNSGLPYFLVSEKEQKGTSFGERFTNAIQQVFEKGYQNIITIGNDSPQLKTSHLTNAHNALTQGKTVLGPSLDGGFYLMGIHKDDFNVELFKRLPWQRMNLFNQISELLVQSDCALHRLQILGDIDHFKDVKRFSGFRSSISVSVLLILATLLKISHQISDSLTKYNSNVSLQQPFNKGSPALLLV
jgi:glycosyltransferase A (GT-A) superfamily protein (DUF2064 family)